MQHFGCNIFSNRSFPFVQISARMMISFLYVQNLDKQACGRVNYELLDEQTLMELLVQDVNEIQELQTDDGEFLQLSLWPGIVLDEESHVREIEYSKHISFEMFFDGSNYRDYTIGPNGSMGFQWIPRHVIVLKILLLDLEGTIETDMLPPVLIKMDLSCNKFSGTFRMSGLPRTLQYLRLDTNCFVGSVDLSSMPPSLRICHIADNRFEGQLDFRNLPSNLDTFFAHGNHFSGSIDFQYLPDTLQNLNLVGNEIKQEKLIVRIPRSGPVFFHLDFQKFGEIIDTHGKTVDGFPWRAE